MKMIDKSNKIFLGRDSLWKARMILASIPPVLCGKCTIFAGNLLTLSFCNRLHTLRNNILSPFVIQYVIFLHPSNIKRSARFIDGGMCCLDCFFFSLKEDKFVFIFGQRDGVKSS